MCGRIYPFYTAWAKELASRTDAGRYVEVKAGHEIYTSQRDKVIAEITGLINEVR